MTTFAFGSPTEKNAHARDPNVARVDSWRINVPDETWLIERILHDLAEGRGGTVFTINLDHLSRLRREPAFRAAYERASYVTADGVPVVMLARAGGAPIDRVTGADLVLPLCRAAAAAGIPVHFFGSRAEILGRAVAEVRRTVGGLEVAGIEAPPMGFDPRGEEARSAAERIAASGAGICFVALGAPKQELFADAALARAPGTFFLGVGAALDFIAGERRRAPRMLQRACLEWAWRAAHEPGRLLPRYFRSAMWLTRHLVRSGLGLTRDALPVRLPDEPGPAVERVVPSTVNTRGR